MPIYVTRILGIDIYKASMIVTKIKSRMDGSSINMIPIGYNPIRLY